MSPTHIPLTIWINVISQHDEVIPTYIAYSNLPIFLHFAAWILNMYWDTLNPSLFSFFFFFSFLFASQLVLHGDYHKRLCLVPLVPHYSTRSTQPALWRSAYLGLNDWDLNPISSSNGIR